MKPLRDKHGRFVSIKDAGKKEIEMAIRLYNEPDPQTQDALAPIRSAAELILILELIIALCIGIVYLGVRL